MVELLQPNDALSCDSHPRALYFAKQLLLRRRVSSESFDVSQAHHHKSIWNLLYAVWPGSVGYFFGYLLVCVCVRVAEGDE